LLFDLVKELHNHRRNGIFFRVGSLKGIKERNFDIWLSTAILAKETEPLLPDRGLSSSVLTEWWSDQVAHQNC
jgi:hypothetical protein